MKKDTFEPGYIYHIYNRGNNKENLFKEDKNYHYFISLMEKHLLPGCDIYAYCLMKNHFHLLVRIKDEKDLSDKLKVKPYLMFSNLFNAYTKAINKMYNRTGSLFQKHPPRKRVQDEDYLKNLIAYIHLNPQSHGFVFDFKKYSFSSYGDYLNNKPSLIAMDYIIGLFGDRQEFITFHNLKGKEIGGVEEYEL
jgi:putative transposase